MRSQHSSHRPTHRSAHGTAIGLVLRDLPGWTCVNLVQQVARRLGPAIQALLGQPVRDYGDVYHALYRAAPTYRHPAVRRLRREDLGMINSARDEIRATRVGFGALDRLLDEGFAVGAVVDGSLVALADTTAQTVRHAEPGVVTARPWRGRGLATACKARTAKEVEEAGSGGGTIFGRNCSACRGALRPPDGRGAAIDSAAETQAPSVRAIRMVSMRSPEVRAQLPAGTLGRPLSSNAPDFDRHGTVSISIDTPRRYLRTPSSGSRSRVARTDAFCCAPGQEPTLKCHEEGRKARTVGGHNGRGKAAPKSSLPWFASVPRSVPHHAPAIGAAPNTP